jgi:hypothetical protein
MCLERRWNALPTAFLLGALALHPAFVLRR